MGRLRRARGGRPAGAAVRRRPQRAAAPTCSTASATSSATRCSTPSRRPGRCSASSPAARSSRRSGVEGALLRRRRHLRPVGLAARWPSCASGHPRGPRRRRGRRDCVRLQPASRCSADAPAARAAGLGAAEQRGGHRRPRASPWRSPHELGGGPLAAGVLTAAVPAGFLLGSWLVLRLPPSGASRCSRCCVAGSCAPLLLTAVVDASSCSCVALGAGGRRQRPADRRQRAFVQAVPAHLRGRAFGVAGTLLMAVQGIVLLGAGALAEVTGPRRRSPSGRGRCCSCRRWPVAAAQARGRVVSRGG